MPITVAKQTSLIKNIKPYTSNKIFPNLAQYVSAEWRVQ